MSAARRSSLQESREKLGEPFQIYSEVVNAGKTVQGTKKKVRWLFGFSSSNQEYEVVLVVSILSGKKVIYEEGKEIVNVTSMLNTDFGHGWSSYSTKRLYRVEANLNMNGELNFIFSIDGVPFSDLPQKHQLKRTSTASHLASGRYGGDEGAEISTTATSTSRRASTGSSVSTTPASSRPASTATMNASRSSVSSAHNSVSKNSDSFDPFATGHSSASFDPFADDFGGASVSTASTHQAKHVSAPAGSISVAKPPAASTKTTPTAAAHRPSITPKTSSASLLFDELPAAPAAAASGGFDAFGDSADPFAPTSSTNQQNNSTASFDAFAPSAPATTTKKPAAAPAAAFDPFASTPAPAPAAPTAANFDPFASAPASTTAAPARRGSALDDFSGLSFNPAPVVMNNHSRPTAAVTKPVEQAPEVKEEAPKDPWQTNLVDLDLSGKAKEASRRSSVNNSGPSLIDLMQQNKGTATTSSSSAFNNSNNQFAAAPFSSNDPFGAPPLLQATPSPAFPSSNQSAGPANLDALLNNAYRPVSTSDAISSLGGMVPAAPQHRGSMIMPNMPPQTGMGAGPAPMMGGGFNNNNNNMNNGARPMSMPMTSGSSNNGNIMSGGIGRSNFIMPPSTSNGSNTQPKNSLDSLDWRGGMK